VARIAQTGASHVSPIVLHLRPGIRAWFMAWLREHHPGLVARYDGLYARGAYAPKGYQDMITERVRAAARRHGLNRTESRPPQSRPRPAEPVNEQLTLM